MASSILLEKPLKFAVLIVKLNQYLVKSKHETIISKQIVRNGTSIGANAIAIQTNIRTSSTV